jgi:hypothetical protein
LSTLALLSVVALLSGAALSAGAGVVSAEVKLGGADDGAGAVPVDVSGALESVASEGWVAAAGLPSLEKSEPKDEFFQRMYPTAATASTAMMTKIFQALLLGGSSSSRR